MLRTLIAVSCLAAAGLASGPATLPEWKSDYLDFMDARLHKIDRKEARVARDTSDRYLPDSLIYRSAFSESKARKMGLDVMRRDLIAIPGEPPSPEWSRLKERIEISLDGLQRLWNLTDSTLDIRARRRYGLDPRLESIRSGTDREWNMDHRAADQARRARKH